MGLHNSWSRHLLAELFPFFAHRTQPDSIHDEPANHRNLQGEFAMYNAHRTFDVTGFRRDDLLVGFHKLRVIATGRKNENSTGSAMTFNAANIRN